MATVGVAMAGGNPSRGRQGDDWYPTPEDVTAALLTKVLFDGDVWEPCCGDGSMSEVIARLGHRVRSTDLVDRGYGEGRGPDWNVLVAERLLAPNVVTNPPFRHAQSMIERMLALRPRTMALLLKSSYFQAKSRTPLFRRHPPAQVIALNWRPDFMRRKRPVMEVSWFVWREGHQGLPAYDVAERKEAEALLSAARPALLAA
jgi:hypothetical protein